MNWIGQDKYGNYQLSGNLVKEILNDEMPKGIQRDWSQSHGNNAWSPFWIYLHQRRTAAQFLLQLAVLLFGRILPEVVWRWWWCVREHPSSKSTLRVFGRGTEYGHWQSSHGSTERDPSRSHKMSYEPKHFLYLPVRVEVMDIIYTQLAENNGTLVNFASGVTTLTLHFKYE